MRRTALVLGCICLIGILAACSGNGDNILDPDAGPLAIELFWAEPATGASPLRVTFTVNITGGVAPYYYAWDYTNDGSFDEYRNGEYGRTLSVFRDYYLKSSDAGGVTQYQAVLSVTDSDGTTVTSDPMDINVLGSTGFILDPDLTYWWTDEPDPENEGQYIARHGQPVYFRAQPIGGQPPYSFQYDFDNDGAVDSTIAAPQNTFTYEGLGIKLFVVGLKVVDSSGEEVYWDYYVPINGIPPDNPEPDFSILLNSSPPANADGLIRIEFDPSGATEGKPLEPELNLSIVVEPGSGGVPPYEYYWDFETDGALDSQVLAPSIPYYDPVRKITINPYLHNEDSQDFTLRCLVIDSGGHSQEITRTVRAVNISNRDDPLDNVPVTYGIVTGAGGDYGESGPIPYGQAQSRSATTFAKFEFNVVGGPGTTVEYQFDANGDLIPEVPEGGAGWEPLVGEDIVVIQAFQGVGYFPANVKIRVLAADLSVIDSTTIEVPISLVMREQIVLNEGTLENRTDHVMAASWTVVPHASNVQMLSERQFVIAGGSRGSTSLNSVQHVRQLYSAPPGTGDIELLVSTTASDRTPMNVARRGAVMWADNVLAGDGADFRIHTGFFNTMLASNEQSLGGTGTVPWFIKNEMLIPQYYPLKDAGATVIPGMGFVIGGGLHKPADESNAVVSGKLISYDSVFDAYGDMSTMPTPRYDCGLAYANDRLYVIGGRRPSGQSVATVEAYDPVTGTWDTSAPAMNERRSGMACQTIGGKIYVIGGADWPFEQTDREFKTTAEVFNPQTGVWSYTLPLPENAVVDDLASVAVPAPGSTNAAGAVVNSIVCCGGEEPVPGTDIGGEVNRLFEFTYYHTVELPEVTE